MSGKKFTARDVLALPMERNDANAKTVSGYLKALLLELWREGEGFSGKRPFGNSDWEYELYKPLVKAGFVEGEIDAHGNLDEVDSSAADEAIKRAIEALT